MGKIMSLKEFENYYNSRSHLSISFSSENNFSLIDYRTRFNSLLVLDNSVLLRSGENYITLSGINFVEVDESILPFGIIYKLNCTYGDDNMTFCLVAIV